ncbi:hypothetical protein ACPV3A_29680 [Paenibacillus sp. Dod16]|uniref:hypothetical protein n=1 Tax=Paenibacillus sp. Dod16 TaxID=3416392 RepID=UPI003CE6BEE5
MTTNSNFEMSLQKLSDFFQLIMDRGMAGHVGALWPVVVRKWGREVKGTEYVYMYPITFFQNLMMINSIHINAETKNERLTMLKFLVDELSTKKIDIHLYHFGMNLLYPYSSFREREDKESVGKRRAEFMETLPAYELLGNDDFICQAWSLLIQRSYPEVGEEIVRVPTFSEVRMLFTPERFGDHTGTYFSDADWLEPIAGRRIEVKRWVGEKDPMTPQPKKEGMIEGPIMLGHEGSTNGLRHFVEGKPVHAGSYIEVKFGDGWIPGRYEWSFEQDSPIRIHSSRHEWISIREGHLVRIKEKG